MQLLRGWNWIRIFRLVVGGAAVIQGILYVNHPLWMMGAVLLIQAVFNVGCCGVGGCAVPSKSLIKKQELNKPADYEELV